MKSLIVIPAYNEQDTIGLVIGELVTEFPRSDILVVNDGSSDETENIVKTFDVHLISMPFNLGVGAAVRAGFKYAHRNGYELMVQFDADGQHVASEITKLIGKISEGDADTVIGSRFHKNSIYKINFTRKLAINFLAILVRLFAKCKISDPTSGFRINNLKAIKYYSRNYPTDYLGDTVESIVNGSKNGIKFTEINIQMNNRQGGEASQNLVQSFAYLLRTTLVVLSSANKAKK